MGRDFMGPAQMATGAGLMAANNPMGMPMAMSGLDRMTTPQPQPQPQFEPTSSMPQPALRPMPPKGIPMPQPPPGPFGKQAAMPQFLQAMGIV